MARNNDELELIKDIASFSKDPLGFVLYAFPWGEGELKDREIEAWQREILIAIRDGLITVTEAIQIAIASGHGIGKSTLVAWIILWSLSTFEDTRGIVTANTETQLKTKTWSELAKWHRLCICGYWFELTATAIYAKDKAHEKTWRFDMIAWSDTNTDAFAGMHNQGKRIVVIFDEASGISNKIWEVTEGALTDENTEIFWFAFGNPTKTTGRFRECFSRYRHRWITKQIDSRTVTITNKKKIQAWIDDYGIDSDFVKVRVRGEFPTTGDKQFIPSDYVDIARGKNIRESEYNFAASIIGVDPAWCGGDEIAIFWRQGNASQLLAVYKKNDDDYVLAQHVARFEDEKNADAVFIDFGYGTGLYSAGKQLGRKWILVPFGGASSDKQYLNKRTEMWGLMRAWLKTGGCIPDDTVLCQELVAPEETMAKGKLAGTIVLESKEDIKEREGFSPNRADALALTFAMPVKKKNRDMLNKLKGNKGVITHNVLPTRKSISGSDNSGRSRSINSSWR